MVPARASARSQVTGLGGHGGQAGAALALAIGAAVWCGKGLGVGGHPVGAVQIAVSGMKSSRWRDASAYASGHQ